MPPGPFVAPDPRVVALLDAASFPVLFDTALVEKRDLFTGTFMPSTDLTGGFRFRATYGAMFEGLEREIARGGRADFGAANDRAAFDFLARALLGRDPAETPLGLDGPKLITKWVLFQIGPLLSLGLPSLVEDAVLHSFRLPPRWCARTTRASPSSSAAPWARCSTRPRASGWAATRRSTTSSSPPASTPSAGSRSSSPASSSGSAAPAPASTAASPRRSAPPRAPPPPPPAETGAGGVPGAGGVDAADEVGGVRGAAHRAPVALQYGRAKRDMVVESHDYGYEVRAGEMLFGYQPMATKDPRVFERAEEFVPERFVGEAGRRLLRHVLWSNGPETEAPTADNKQCAGKDFVVAVARLLVAELFLRYDSFDVEVGSSALGSSVRITSLKKATF
uniref:Allene oxide synthase 1, chloroplastic n=1 Tax=Ananas comosus var. bracteatus TaxID=296719 RepID=A0A6V7NLM4_ANACO|nr:unnamed protein product [Ananas comosus var. bracteatus]